MAAGSVSFSSSLEVAVVVMDSCSGGASEGISFSSEISSFSDRSSAVYSSSGGSTTQRAKARRRQLEDPTNAIEDSFGKAKLDLSRTTATSPPLCGSSRRNFLQPAFLKKKLILS